MSRCVLLDDHKGKYYVSWMHEAVITLGARNYLEIGSRDGNSLRPIPVKSIAIDPQFAITSDVIGGKPSCHFYQMTSDLFFRYNNPELILGDKVDFVFLDGLHIYEYLLRDFANVERFCRKNSIVCLHDCIPTDLSLTTRSQIGSNAWTGDVWKVPMLLRRYRPELKIHFLDCAPTGLVVITNLDPDSTVLQENFCDIINEHDYDDSEAGDKIREHYARINLLSADALTGIYALGAKFWL